MKSIDCCRNKDEARSSPLDHRSSASFKHDWSKEYWLWQNILTALHALTASLCSLTGIDWGWSSSTTISATKTRGAKKAKTTASAKKNVATILAKARRENQVLRAGWCLSQWRSISPTCSPSQKTLVQNPLSPDKNAKTKFLISAWLYLQPKSPKIPLTMTWTSSAMLVYYRPTNHLVPFACW